MKPSEFKQIIKESVKEAIQEEIKDILLEALKSPKTVVTESKQMLTSDNDTETLLTKRQKYMDILGETAGIAPGKDTISFNSSNVFKPTGGDTTSEGSALPSGELNMNQIMGLLNNK